MAFQRGSWGDRWVFMTLPKVHMMQLKCVCNLSRRVYGISIGFFWHFKRGMSDNIRVFITDLEFCDFRKAKLQN